MADSGIGAGPTGIFISYRRDDAGTPAQWLYELLLARFGPDVLFKDVDSIPPGQDFVATISRAVGSCAVLLAVIGRQWLTVTGPGGGRRLDDPGDFVCLEIETALTRGITVIPVLVDGAPMPQRDLPDGIADLARRNAVTLSPVRFMADTDRLAAVLERILAERAEAAGSGRSGGEYATGGAGPSPAGVPSGTTARASMVPRAEAPPARRRDEIGISLWGGPASGKTAFLAALSTALIHYGDGWSMIANDEASEEALTRLSEDLTGKQVFPEATVGIGRYRVMLRGQVPETARKRLWQRSGSERRSRPVTMNLTLVDAQGSFLASDEAGTDAQRELIGCLAESRGILCMFDPFTETECGDTADRTLAVCNQLTRTMLGTSHFAERLPHFVAVCVTKFDAAGHLETAAGRRLIARDADSALPGVLDSDARAYLWELCKDSGGGEQVIRILERYFIPERIRYFVTSATGFHIERDRERSTVEYGPRGGPIVKYVSNVDPGGEFGAARLRGRAHPVNVAEPVVWLSTQVASWA